MTLAEINKRVAEIETVADDDESAHGKEDQLYYDFVDFLARTIRGPVGEKARALRKVRDIRFARWCA